MSDAAKITVSKPQASGKKDSRSLVRDLASHEMVFAVVGPVGSGTSEIAKSLENFLSGEKITTKIIKASEAITAWGKNNGYTSFPTDKIALTTLLQDVGDKMREKDRADVAARLIAKVRELRAEHKGEATKKGVSVEPDGKNRAYILDSLRNPAEVALLRGVYGDAFCLIGVVCDEEIRRARLKKKYSLSSSEIEKINNLMSRDANAEEKHGQQVADTFHLADFFIDNTASRFIDVRGKEKENPEWIVMDELGRLIDILTHSEIVRPRPNETAMYHAYGARMRSSCLSRQVGAALMDIKGNIVSTGTNEVPRAGGGVYGSVFANYYSTTEPDPAHDHRCAFSKKYCSNTKEQNEIIDELIQNIPELKPHAGPDLLKRIRKTRIGQLIEFSRAVHAEMDALISAARQGISTVGTRMFVTTFPCHNCARHIVTAGVDEVQFIEPYLKSRALPLHGDAITDARKDWLPPSTIDTEKEKQIGKAPQVLFRPFTGIAPRLYRRAFYKDRDLKDNTTGELLKSFPPPDGFGSSEVLKVSYAQVETTLADKIEEA